MNHSLLSVLVVSLILISCMGSSASPVKRSEPSNVCARSAPCGWYVYKPYVRTLDYHIRGPCTCPVDTKCVRVGDDISIFAFVYRCRSEQEAEGLEELPTTSDDGQTNTTL